MRFNNSNHGVIHTKDDIFLSVYTSKEFKELENYPRDSTARPRKAIEMLETRHFQISEELKAKIYQLYNLPDFSPQA